MKKNNALIAEFIGFIRYYPNMTMTSDLAYMYIWPRKDTTFWQGLYVTSRIDSVGSEGRKVYIGVSYPCFSADMPFDNSWDWLMPVIKKLDKEYGDQLFDDDFFDIMGDPHDIKEAYNLVIEFIKQLNHNDA